MITPPATLLPSPPLVSSRLRSFLLDAPLCFNSRSSTFFSSNNSSSPDRNLDAELTSSSTNTSNPRQALSTRRKDI